MAPILCAEDDENDVFFIQRAFKQVGILPFLVILANGQLVIDYLLGRGSYADRIAHPLPCLLLLDLNMPLKTGLEVLTWIRGHPPLRVLPVIMLTSSSRPEDINRAYLQGANGYLVKPGDPNQMVSMVKSIKDFWLTHNRLDALT
jgi:CheY-like chemotaxis protein